MDAIESMITGRKERMAEADVLEASASLFMWLSDAEYVAAVSPEAWPPVKESARALAHNDEERMAWSRALHPLALNEYAIVRNELLVSGMPFATLPVESLYKQWSNEGGNLFGGTRGLYLGDPAQHLSAVYAQLDIIVPPAFAAMPDHIALELELLALLLRAGNLRAAYDLVEEHLDWLALYALTLDERMRDLAGSTGIPATRLEALARGLEFLHTLTLLVDRVAHKAIGRRRR